ncbi:MAG: peptide-methionine (S)-S-oxide reductase MsrA [Candidatus Omnitrophica bacterium]|nr:peptide-methionine (S)-S-oxide reductase MsrA [Candidatus Omnitrophota bacterium]
MKKAVFGAGCFWGVEKILGHVPGVTSTSVGFSGGKVANPTYRQVCEEDTGHAEVVEVVYDGTPAAYKELLTAFWEYHDPTTPDRQGPDVGSQYRSVIFYEDEEQAALARRSKEILESARIFKDPIVTEIVPAGPYTRAEEYHQKYLQKNPFGYCSHHLQSKKIRQLLKEKL